MSGNILEFHRFGTSPGNIVQGWETPNYGKTFQQGRHRIYLASCVNDILFNVDRKGDILGFGCYVGSEETTMNVVMNANVHIWVCDRQTNVMHGNTTQGSDGRTVVQMPIRWNKSKMPRLVKLWLKNPVHVTPHVMLSNGQPQMNEYGRPMRKWYAADIGDLAGIKTFYGINGKESVTIQAVTMRFRNNTTYAPCLNPATDQPITTVETGQIPEIYFRAT